MKADKDCSRKQYDQVGELSPSAERSLCSPWTFLRVACLPTDNTNPQSPPPLPDTSGNEYVSVALNGLSKGTVVMNERFASAFFRASRRS